MGPMDAFEQQLTRVATQIAGPVRPVDAMGVARSTMAEPVSHRSTLARWFRGGATTPNERGFSMFSALKFVAAAAIVALFGGFLAAGVLTTPQDGEVAPAAVTESPAPTTTEELLSGMVTEEVEPGVFRVINDGVRDLALGDKSDIVVGHDDGIWLLRENHFRRLGSEAGHVWREVGRPHRIGFEVTPDGTVWVVPHKPGGWPSVGPVFSFDGDGWSRTQSLPDDVWSIAVAPDGTLWASWDEGTRILGPDGWQPLDGEPIWAEELHLTDSGNHYAQVSIWVAVIVSRYQDGAWQQFIGGQLSFDAAPDGTVWTLGGDLSPDEEEPFEPVEGLARFDGGAWEVWGPDALPDMGLGIALDPELFEPFLTTFMAAPDGSLWASLWQSGPDGDEPPAHGLWTEEQRANKDLYDPQCDGLVRFDGEAADRFLPGQCVSMDIAADGSVWVLASEDAVWETDNEQGWVLADDATWDLYVITPEAVAGAE